MKKIEKNITQTTSGFTMVEVMLVLALTGLLFVGLIAGTMSAIRSQRYNDTIRSYTEFFRAAYNEVISPESDGDGKSDRVVLGKLLVFKADQQRVYTATITGGASLSITGSNLMAELAASGVGLFCGKTTPTASPTSVSYYEPLWQAEAYKTKNNDGTGGTDRFKGAIAILHSPDSNTIHTIFYPDANYDLEAQCTPSSNAASNAFKADIEASPAKYTYQSIGLCIRTSDTNLPREIHIAEDGRNASAVNALTASVADSVEFVADGRKVSQCAAP